VQADKATDWYGMPTGAPMKEAGFSLDGEQPAYLEVTVDPAAHGERGLGPIKRAVIVRAADGEELRFEVTAHVVD
jgi:hypothetical protein